MLGWPRIFEIQGSPENFYSARSTQNRAAVANITRNNHYVPQATLKRWSHDGQSVWAYRLLVSHHGVRQWRSELIARLTRQTDLYTEHRGGAGPGARHDVRLVVCVRPQNALAFVAAQACAKR